MLSAIMTTLRSLLCLSLALFAAAVLSAQSASQGAAKAGGKAAEEEMGTIDGMTLNRSNGTFLGLTVEGGQWKLRFYDEKKKPAKVDVTRANARWVMPMKADHERTVLNPTPDGTALVGARFVRPPYNFKLYLTILRGEGDTAEVVETYTLDYRG